MTKKLSKAALYAVVGVLAILAFGLSGKIGESIGRSTVQRYQAGKMEAAVEEAQRIAVLELRKQMPMKIDEITTLTAVMAAGGSFIYRYDLSVGSTSRAASGLEQRMRHILPANVCRDQSMRRMMDVGAAYIYTYFASDGIMVADVKIRLADCRSLERAGNASG